MRHNKVLLALASAAIIVGALIAPATVHAEFYSCSSKDCGGPQNGCSGDEAEWNGCVVNCYTGGVWQGGYTCPGEI